MAGSENGVILEACDRLDRREGLIYKKMDSFAVFYEENSIFPGNKTPRFMSVSLTPATLKRVGAKTKSCHLPVHLKLIPIRVIEMKIGMAIIFLYFLHLDAVIC